MSLLDKFYPHGDAGLEYGNGHRSYVCNCKLRFPTRAERDAHVRLEATAATRKPKSPIPRPRVYHPNWTEFLGDAGEWLRQLVSPEARAHADHIDMDMPDKDCVYCPKEKP